MKRRVRIVVKPKAQSGLEVKMGNMNPGLYGKGTNGNRQFTLPTKVESSKFSEAPIEVNTTLSAVPREEANIEAERGEVIMTDMTGDGIPETYKVGGNRHFAGGTPLNVPKDSFVFSDTNKMKLKDENLLKMFGVSKKTGGVTPADIAKKYDINQYRKILADPDSDKLQRETAEAMITNYNLKLAKLALAQESLKGFPQGIPAVAMPYIETSQLDPASFTQTQGEQEQPSADMGIAQYGGTPAQRKKAALKLLAEKGHLLQNAGTNIGDALSNTWDVIKGTSNPLKTLDMAWDFTKAVPERIIDQILEPYMDKPEVNAPPLKTLPGKKKAVAAPVLDPDQPSVDTFFPDPSTIKTQEEADRLARLWEITHPTYKKALGGSLDKMQSGGNPYALKIASAPVTGTGKKKTISTPTNYAKVRPYGDDPVAQAFLQKYMPEGSDLYGKDITHQAQIKKGVYGEDVMDMSAFAKRNPGFLKAYPDFDPSKEEDLVKFEKYHKQDTYDKTYNFLKKKGASEAEAKKTADAVAKQLSFIDQQGDVRHQDKKWGNYHRSRAELMFPEDVQAPAEETPVAAAKPDEPGAIIPPVKHLQGTPAEDPAAWWLQDIIKTAGAAGDFARIKKYNPWQATPSTYLPTPTFYDPTRELAANAEQANIQTQALGQFAGPQALSARSSAIQGQAAKNAADVMGRYNNLNVGVANDFEVRNAGILNDAGRQKVGLDTQLFDKYTIVNQQFDNSRNLARQNLRQSYIDAITNRANTYNLNTVYPQAAVDPMSGGKIYGHNFKGLANNNQGIAGITDQENSGIPAMLDKLTQKYGEEKAMKLLELMSKSKGA